MRITYKIEDGYIHNQAYTVYVDDDELEECETIEEKIELIDQYIDNDFSTRINWYWDHSQIEK